MGRRSLQASEDGIQAIKKALKRNKWSQTLLAGRLNCSRQTIWSLLQGNPVDCELFMQACQELDLNWEEIAKPELPEPEIPEKKPVDTLVQTLRQEVQPYIQNRCGTMRVLNMTQPIGLGEIYTDVNILEKLTANRRLELEELLAACQIENGADFDRFGLSRATEKRKPGLEVVQQYKHLMVLGRPGAGKTTFLKHLAIECISGNHFADRVPLFVTLKEFAETDNQPDLANFLATLLLDSDLTQLLSAGKALLLLDGLDEVKETDIRRVNQQIRSFAERFDQNQIVVTCRIAAKSYIFEQFVEVEVADFNPEQIEIFVRKWFQAKQPQKADRFLQHLKEHKPIQELANNPLLLTLLCLIFEEKNKFKESRVDLYSEGVDLLLEKWDDSRDIERDQIYKTLSIRRRSDLLGKLALATFETGSYFFRRREAEDQICEYIRNLPGVESTPEALDINSKKILRSIEAQHGLLTERAVNIYSFSHLTFHEYFVALEIIQSNQFHLLLNNITNKRWREVILLTASMLRNADDLVRSMKQKIDRLLAEDVKLQQFLYWIYWRSQLVDTAHQSPSIRAFYFMLSFDIFIDTDDGIQAELVVGVKRAMWRVHALRFALDLNLDFALDCFENTELKHQLKQIRTSLSDLSWDNLAVYKKWFEENEKSWIEDFDSQMPKHYRVKYDSQFSKKQGQLLRQYYDTNKLLVDCLNLPDIYVSQNVREEIEAMLLLPISTIKEREESQSNRLS